MIEVTVLSYLAAALSPVPVYMETPAPMPEKFVVLRKTGSSRRNFLTDSTFTAQSYGETLYQAAELNEQVKAALDQLPALGEITRAELNSDYVYNDVNSKRYRYQAVYDVSHY